jgi:hypothetical protein
MGDVITEPDQVTPEWLTSVLARNGFLRSGKVLRVTHKLTKTLQVSIVSRFEVEYSSNPDPHAPTKLFLKQSKPSPHLNVPDVRFSEVEFYRSIGHEMTGPPLINCFDLAADTHGSHILMEDLSETHFQTENPDAPAQLYSELGVKCLAEFHAYWWNHPKLGNGIGKVFDQSWLKSFTADLNVSVNRFLDFLGDDLSAVRHDIYKRMLASSDKIWGRLTDRSGLTITHGDAHWWNFLYPRDPHKEQTRIFDWQLWHIDLGARDLAFLVAGGGFAERRPEMEMKLVRLYFDTMLENGVTNYSWRDFWDDYRFSAIRNLNFAVILWSQGKHQSTWTNIMERAFASYRDLECDELIGH